MKYAYQVSPKWGILPILGSVMRAVGKGWRVVIIGNQSHQHHEVVLRVQKLLKNPAQMRIIAAEDFFDDVSHLDAKNVVSATQLGICLDTTDWKRVSARLGKEVTDIKHWMVVDSTATNHIDDYDLISDFSWFQLKNEGVTAIVGTGKGKTTSALGIALQAVTDHQKVSIIQWFKEKKQGDLTWAINEHQFEFFINQPTQIQFYPMGLGFFGSPQFDRVSGSEAYQYHRDRAYAGLELARKHITSGDYAVVVLDECVDTVSEIARNIKYSLLDLTDLQKFLTDMVPVATKNGTRVVVTGRRVTPDWEKWVSGQLEVTEVKHPWKTKQQGAISGLDF